MLFYLDWRFALAALLAAPASWGCPRVLRAHPSRSPREATPAPARSGRGRRGEPEQPRAGPGLRPAGRAEPPGTAGRTRAAFSAQMVAIRLRGAVRPVRATCRGARGAAVDGLRRLGAGQRPDHPRRAAGLRRLPQPALRTRYAGFGGLWNAMASAKRRYRTDHRDARPEAGGRPTQHAAPAVRAGGALTLHGSRSPIPTPSGPRWSGST